MSTETPATGLPAGSSTRPVTVIRPGVAGSGLLPVARSGFARGFAGSAVRGSSFAAWGSCVTARDRASHPALVASEVMSNNAVIVSLSFWQSMVLRTSWARATAGRSRPPVA